MTLLHHFLIPATPVAKGRARTRVVKTKGGKAFASHYTPAETRDFERLVKDYARQALGDAQPLACPVDLLVEFRFAIPDSWPKWKRELAADGLVHHTKKPDCSNLVKAIEDACNGVLWKDDGQVVGSIQDKVWTTGPECIAVHVYRRFGVACQVGRAEAGEELTGYRPSVRTNHLPLGRRMRTLRLVTP